MPRVKPLGDSAKAKAQYMRDDYAIIGAVHSYRSQNGLTPADVAAQIGVSPSAYYSRLRDPSQFRLGELRKLARCMASAKYPVKLIVGGSDAG